MSSFKIIIISIFFVSVVSGSVKNFEPCNRGDNKCLSEIINDFITQNCDTGIPDRDVKPLEPFKNPKLMVKVNQTMAYKFENIIVTGMKNLPITDYQKYWAENLESGNDKFTVEGGLNIAADLKIICTTDNEEEELYKGSYTAFANVSVTTQFGFKVIKKGGEEYIDVGPETINSEFTAEPVVNFDSDAKDMKLDNAQNNDLLCKMMEPAFIESVKYIRVYADLYTVQDFFKD